MRFDDGESKPVVDVPARPQSTAHDSSGLRPTRVVLSKEYPLKGLPAPSRTVLVTGASSGIGHAIQEELLRRGHRVIAASRSPQPAASTDAYLAEPVDLADLDGISEAFKGILARSPAIDAVVSNAGGPGFGGLEQLSVDHIRSMIDLNLTSHLLVVRSVLPHLKRRGGGDVLLMGSEAALRGGQRGSIYCAAKFGLRGFGQALRQECSSSGVRVTLVHPGMVRTPFFDELDFAPGDGDDNAIEPDDVASAVCLALDARAGTVFDEIVLTPLKKVVQHRRKPR